MGNVRHDRASFKQLLKQRTPLLGTFVKMPTTQTIEIIGAAGFDLVVIDAEHAPLDRAAVDLMILSCLAASVAPVVRVGSSDQILTALDCGAVGVMVPHVSSAEEARIIAGACRYAGGSRGFAGLTRASGWGARKPVAHMAEQDGSIVCIAMIEDAGAVERIDEIAAVEGIDALFVGRGDLGATFGTDPDAASKVAALSELVAAAAGRAGKPLVMLATSTEDAARMRGLGVAAMLVSSDHGMLKSAAQAAINDYATKVN